jgi:osmotically-inducible protein OsmY
MADNNRNWGGYRSSNQDWNDDNSRYGQESNYDDRNSNRGRYQGNQGNSDWNRSGNDYGQGSTYGESRHDRDEYNRGNYGSSNQSSYDRDYSNYGSNENRGRDHGSSMGGGFGFGESGFGSRYRRERQSYTPGGYQNFGGGSGFGQNSWTGGYGGSSYGNNFGNNYGSGYGSSAYGSSGSYGAGQGQGESFRGGSGYGQPYYGNDYNSGSGRSFGERSYGGNYGNSGSNWGERRENDFRGGRGREDDRGWWDKTTDEVASWFGDEDAERRRRMDRMHRGRGPKNYQRSDERIKDDINDRLSDDWFIDASDIDVTVQNGEVTLTGTVDERTAKRRAEDIAEAVSGVKHVENRLRVSSNQHSGSSMGSSGSSASGLSSESISNSSTATGATGTGSTGALGSSTGTSRSKSTLVSDNK